MSLCDYKSDNLQYNKLVCWADGTNDSSTKRLTFQVFFIISYRLQEIMKKKYLEHQTLGGQVICPISPANQRIIF